MRLNRLFPSLFGLLTWGSRVAAHRRVLATLGGFDDRELADIGLTRQDLRDVGALPLAADPTAVLAIRADERAEAALAARRRLAASSTRPERRGGIRVAAE